MSLITCPECKKEVSDEASACPNCGFPIKKNLQPQTPQVVITKKRISYKRIYFYSLLIAIVLSVISVISNSNNNINGLADPTKELGAQLIYGVPFSAFICSLPLFVILGGAIELYYRIKK